MPREPGAVWLPPDGAVATELPEPVVAGRLKDIVAARNKAVIMVSPYAFSDFIEPQDNGEMMNECPKRGHGVIYKRTATAKMAALNGVMMGETR